jgi:hypothetical protein
MTQSFTPNDLIKNLYEPESGFTQNLSAKERSELASFNQVKNALDQAAYEPSDRVVDRILAYSKHKESIKS